MSSQVRVTNLAEGTHQEVLRGFFSNCGTITAIDVDATDGGRSAVVTFATDDGACVAAMVSGSVINGNAVTVTHVGGGASAAGGAEGHGDPSTESGIDKVKVAVQGMIANGVVHGEELVRVVRGRLVALDERHHLRHKAASGAAAVVDTVKSTVAYCMGKTTVGEATAEQHGDGNQPQWGPAPTK